jgi:3-oxoacyl-[acyl-carrier protein] reductase
MASPMSEKASLKGKVALVTGASRGIGFAIARRLGRLGAKVSLSARDAKRLEQAASELRIEGMSTFAVPADVSRASDVANLVEKTEQSLGPIEILVNNAGIGYFGPIHKADEATWDGVLDTNLKSVFLASKAVAPGMIERRSGHIINTASLAGKNAFAGGGIYCASKWGLLGLTECMAEDLRPYGIRVSAICPGSVATDFSPHVGKDTTKMLQPEDIAHVVEMIVTQAPQSFVSEVLLRPTQKP